MMCCATRLTFLTGNEAKGRSRMSKNSEYFSTAEFISHSGLSRTTVCRYLDNGGLPKIQPGGKHCRVLIPRNALESFHPSPDVSNIATCEACNPGNNVQKTDPIPNLQQTQLHGPKPRWRVCR